MKLLILALISFSALGASSFKDGSYGVKEVRLNHPEISGLCSYGLDNTEEGIIIDDGAVISNYSIGVFPQTLSKSCGLKFKKTFIEDVILLTTVKTSSIKLEVAAGLFRQTDSVYDSERLQTIGFIPFGASSIFGFETYYLLRPEVKFAGKDSLVFHGDCKALKKKHFFSDTFVKCDLKDKMGYVLLKRD